MVGTTHTRHTHLLIHIFLYITAHAHFVVHTLLYTSFVYTLLFTPCYAYLAYTPTHSLTHSIYYPPSPSPYYTPTSHLNPHNSQKQAKN